MKQTTLWMGELTQIPPDLPAPVAALLRPFLGKSVRVSIEEAYPLRQSFPYRNKVATDSSLQKEPSSG